MTITISAVLETGERIPLAHAPDERAAKRIAGRLRGELAQGRYSSDVEGIEMDSGGDATSPLETDRYRLTLTDYAGNVTVRYAGTSAAAVALSSDAVRAYRPDPNVRRGRSSSERREPLYVRCERVLVRPDGTEVPDGMWTQSSEGLTEEERQTGRASHGAGLPDALMALMGGPGDPARIPAIEPAATVQLALIHESRE